MDTPLRRPRFLSSLPSGEAVPAQFAKLETSPRPTPPQAKAAPEAPAGPEPLPPPAKAQAPAPPPPAPSPPLPALDVASFGPTPPAPPAPPPAPVAPAALDPRVVAALAALKAESERLAEQARSDALEIGFAVARRILEHELSVSPQPLFGFIRAAIQRAGEQRQLKVRLCPADHERLEEARLSGATGQLAIATLELVRDPSLSVGDVVVEGESATVDGRLGTRLAELARAVEEARDEVA